MKPIFSRFLAAAFLFGGAVQADDFVIDDAALSKDFAHKLGAMVDEGHSISGKKAGELLKTVVDKKIPLPEAAQPCSLESEGTVYEKCLPAVVAIGSVYKCGKCNDWHLGAFATGWILSSDGLIVTNHHVLQKEDNNTLGVMTVDGSVFPLKEILAANEAGDAAVFRVDTLGKKLPYLRMAAEGKVGEEISIISHPKGRFYCLSEGVVSRFHSQAKSKNAKAIWMSVTADYAVGSSGGPVLNANGEVVGMVSSTLTATTGVPRGAEKTPQAAAAGTVQMVFKDCVSLATMRPMFNP
ncbi:MAG: serine protease [Verrucomicrobiales bacterium]